MKAWRLKTPVLNLGDKVIRGRQAKVILHNLRTVKAPASKLFQALMIRGGY